MVVSWGAGHMQLVVVACHIQASFILIDHRARDQGLFDLLLNGGQVVGAPGNQVAEGSFTRRDSKQVLQHPAGASQGQQLLLHQLDRYGRNPWAVLYGRTDLRGNAATVSCWHCGHGFCSLWRSCTTRWASGTSTRRGEDMGQVCLTLLTAWHRVHHHLIGTRREQQGIAWVGLLTAWLLSAFLAQALGLMAEPIRRRGQVAMVAIFGQLLLLQAEFSFQQHDLLLLYASLLSLQPLLVWNKKMSLYVLLTERRKSCEHVQKGDGDEITKNGIDSAGSSPACWLRHSK